MSDPVNCYLYIKPIESQNALPATNSEVYRVVILIEYMDLSVGSMVTVVGGKRS